MSTVAVLDSTRPRTAVSTNIAASSSTGRPVPTTSTTRSAMSSPAPLRWMAVDMGISAPTSTTVSHDTAR